MYMCLKGLSYVSIKGTLKLHVDLCDADKKSGIKPTAEDLLESEYALGEDSFYKGNEHVPPHPGCGDCDQDSHAWVSGWYPAAPELGVLKKAYSSQRNRVRCVLFLRSLRREDGFPRGHTLIFYM